MISSLPQAAVHHVLLVPRRARCERKEQLLGGGAVGMERVTALRNIDGMDLLRREQAVRGSLQVDLQGQWSPLDRVHTRDNAAKCMTHSPQLH